MMNSQKNSSIAEYFILNTSLNSKLMTRLVVHPPALISK